MATKDLPVPFCSCTRIIFDGQTDRYKLVDWSNRLFCYLPVSSAMELLQIGYWKEVGDRSEIVWIRLD